MYVLNEETLKNEFPSTYLSYGNAISSSATTRCWMRGILQNENNMFALRSFFLPSCLEQMQSASRSLTGQPTDSRFLPPWLCCDSVLVRLFHTLPLLSLGHMHLILPPSLYDLSFAIVPSSAFPSLAPPSFLSSPNTGPVKKVSPRLRDSHWSRWGITQTRENLFGGPCRICPSGDRME